MSPPLQFPSPSSEPKLPTLSMSLSGSGGDTGSGRLSVRMTEKYANIQFCFPSQPLLISVSLLYSVPLAVSQFNLLLCCHECDKRSQSAFVQLSPAKRTKHIQIYSSFDGITHNHLSHYFVCVLPLSHLHS